MKLAVSNIAWGRHDDPEVLKLLAASGVTGIEVAPTKVWPNWEGATVEAAEAYRKRLEDAGFAIPALQAVLFGKPELSLFVGGADGRRKLLEHFVHILTLAIAMDAKVVVLGAPKARDVGDLGFEEACAIAGNFFAWIDHFFAGTDVRVCIEPNPAAYGCNFITTSEEGARFVESLDYLSTLGLHLDAAGMQLAGEDPAESVRRLRGRFSHFHISEPNLGGFEAPRLDHDAIGKALAETGYDGWVSVEMREQPNALKALEAACAVARRCYGGRA